MSLKKVYRFISVLFPIIVTTILVLLYLIIRFLRDKVSYNTFVTVLISFSVISLFAVIAVAIFYDITRKKYYNDDKYWKPEIFKINQQRSDMFIDFLKNRLMKNGYIQIPVNANKIIDDDAVMFCKKEKGKEAVCIALIDGDAVVSDNYSDFLRGYAENIRSSKICNNLKIRSTSTLIPIIYTENPEKFNGLTESVLMYCGFFIYPCVADFISNELSVTTLLCTQFKGSIEKKRSEIATNEILSLLNE